MLASLCEHSMESEKVFKGEYPCKRKASHDIRSLKRSGSTCRSVSPQSPPLSNLTT